MPELPEVETIRQQLKTLIIAKEIKDVQVLYQPIVKHPIELFKSTLIGQRFMDINRYGKYLMFQFESHTLISHLRMEGKYYLRESLSELTKHDHIIFALKNGQYLTYHDVRKFGTMELVKKGDALNVPSIQKLGPEVNDASIDARLIYQKIKSSSRAIKSLLLDQSVVCGLGNIYVDETLFMSRIHPETKGHSLRLKDVKSLLDNARIVVEKAIALGGTTIRTYHSTFGIDGRFQNELNVHTKKGEPCPVCQEEIIKIRVGGRGTYYCPHCQKKGNL
jgi:formamidopyrimidine-DNA glycosylase